MREEAHRICGLKALIWKQLERCVQRVMGASLLVQSLSPSKTSHSSVFYGLQTMWPSPTDIWDFSHGNSYERKRVPQSCCVCCHAESFSTIKRATTTLTEILSFFLISQEIVIYTTSLQRDECFREMLCPFWTSSNMQSSSSEDGDRVRSASHLGNTLQ